MTEQRHPSPRRMNTSVDHSSSVNGLPSNSPRLRPGNDDRNVSVDARPALGGHELVTDLARSNGLEELPPGRSRSRRRTPSRLGKGSDRFGAATTAWFQSAISAEKTSKVVLLLLSVMPEAYGLAPHRTPTNQVVYAAQARCASTRTG